VAAALAGATHNRASAAVLATIPGGWRNVVSGNQQKIFRDTDGAEHRISYRFARSGLQLPDDPDLSLIHAAPETVVLAEAGVGTAFLVARYGSGEVFVDSPLGSVAFTSVPLLPEPQAVLQKGSLLAPMPGSVIRLGAALGDTVTAGQPLVWLEAMKMEHTIAAPADGVLTQLSVSVGQQVEVGAVLARVETPEGEQQ
jgi:propionyl-CoA carboxylase alpha chain